MSVIGIIYGALAALAQTDIKRLVAYSSVSHMGFIVLGIFALNSTALEGSSIQMLNHGLTTGALFACVGMIYERYHTRDINAIGGLWVRMPILALFLIVAVLGSAAVPGLNGFVGEFPILVGTFETQPPGGGARGDGHGAGCMLFAMDGAEGAVRAAQRAGATRRARRDDQPRRTSPHGNTASGRARNRRAGAAHVLDRGDRRVSAASTRADEADAVEDQSECAGTAQGEIRNRIAKPATSVAQALQAESATNAGDRRVEQNNPTSSLGKAASPTREQEKHL